MAEVDTSSYLKPAPLPVQKSALGQMQEWGALKQQQQQIESGAITIDRQKLDLTNQRFGEMAKMFTALTQDPQLDLGKVSKATTDLVKMGIIPQQQAATFLSTLPNTTGMPPQESAKVLKGALEQHIARAGTVMEAINSQYGSPQMVTDNKQIIPTTVSPMRGVRQTGLPIAVQQGPETRVFNPETNREQFQGVTPPESAPGMATGFPPAVGAAAPQPRSRPALPVEQPAQVQPMWQPPPRNFNERFSDAFPRGGYTTAEPGFAEGMKQRTEDQNIATAKMSAVKPAIQALKLMDKGLVTGPGTAQFNDLVAAAKAWGVADIKAENDPTVLRQELEKKLAQYVGNSPIAARSDAAQILAEAGSPNPKKQLLPALQKLTRDAIILDRVEAARPNAFAGKNYAEYGTHRSTFPQSIDERAFGLDLMPKAEAQKLLKTMRAKYEKNPNDSEVKKFERSLEIAKAQGFFTPADLQ